MELVRGGGGIGGPLIELVDTEPPPPPPDECGAEDEGPLYVVGRCCLAPRGWLVDEAVAGAAAVDTDMLCERGNLYGREGGGGGEGGRRWLRRMRW